MVGEVTSASISFFRIVSMGFLTYLLWSIVLSIGNGAYIWYAVGDWRPFSHATAGLLLSGDVSTKNAVTFLADDSSLSKIDTAYRSDIIFGFQRRIILNLLIFSLFFYFIFRALMWVGGNWATEPLNKVILFSVTLMFIFTAQFMYNVFVNGNVVVPMSGIYELVKHPSTMLKVDVGSYGQTIGGISNDMLNSTTVVQNSGQQVALS